MNWSRLNELALLSVSRACAFACLAIFCFMIGMAGYPLVALKSGAVLMMFSSAVLVIKAQRSPVKPYRRTELWVLLAPEERPSTRFAQQIISATLREMFLKFAGYFAFGAFCCFAVAMALQLLNQLFGV